MKIVDKRPSKPEPLRVKDCTPGEVVVVASSLPHTYYFVTNIGGEVYGINLDGGGYVFGDIRVTHKVCAEVHVTGVEPV